MTPERIEYWYDHLNLLTKEMGLSPTDREARRRWANVVGALGNLRMHLRLMHGNWKEAVLRNREVKNGNQKQPL